jgi:hypothetical protein
VSRQRWRSGATRLTDDQVNARVARARSDIAVILGNVLDDEAGLARIYAVHGRQVPAGPGPAGAGDDEGGQVQAVCDRIAMLESALAQAASPDAPSSQARMYLSMGRQFLFELRSGLASRNLAAEDAFRLLSNVRHDLHEADSTLRQEQRLPLGSTLLTRIGELRELTSDLAGQLDSLGDQVMKLFGYTDDPAVVPVPQH